MRKRRKERTGREKEKRERKGQVEDDVFAWEMPGKGRKEREG